MANDHRIDMDNLNTKHSDLDEDFNKRPPGSYDAHIERLSLRHS